MSLRTWQTLQRQDARQGHREARPCGRSKVIVPMTMNRNFLRSPPASLEKAGFLASSMSQPRRAGHECGQQQGGEATGHAITADVLRRMVTNPKLHAKYFEGG